MKSRCIQKTTVISQIQTALFDEQSIKLALTEGMSGSSDATFGSLGSLVEFTGFVRADKVEEGQPLVTAIELEHYPAMTEKALNTVMAKAVSRFDCLAMALVHRVGKMQVGEPIVYVCVLSSHRAESFACAQFLMDYLKSEVPLWKREHFAEQSRWVDQKLSDVAAHSRWD
ncbi:MAG: molybdenum cofactor biosynthesis protein MoaE [Sinobacterium sp.]|nr:molybdenum cofactor biosynthesis protein MoaE [Sinobacterium sp.]